MAGDPDVRIDVPASASPEEAAALVAAVEQFLRDTTLAAPAPQRTDAWTRAARLEGVRRAPDAHPWAA